MTGPVRISKQERIAVEALPPGSRLKYCIKRMVDLQFVWCAIAEGQALLVHNSIGVVVYIWPARVYTESWHNFNKGAPSPVQVSLSALVDILIPLVVRAQGCFELFPTGKYAGESMKPEDLVAAIQREELWYESS